MIIATLVRGDFRGSLFASPNAAGRNCRCFGSTNLLPKSSNSGRKTVEEPPRFMTVNQAVEQLLEVEGRQSYQEGVLGEGVGR